MFVDLIHKWISKLIKISWKYYMSSVYHASLQIRESTSSYCIIYKLYIHLPSRYLIWSTAVFSLVLYSCNFIAMGFNYSYTSICLCLVIIERNFITNFCCLSCGGLTWFPVLWCLCAIFSRDTFGFVFEIGLVLSLRTFSNWWKSNQSRPCHYSWTFRFKVVTNFNENSNCMNNES